MKVRGEISELPQKKQPKHHALHRSIMIGDPDKIRIEL